MTNCRILYKLSSLSEVSGEWNAGKPPEIGKIAVEDWYYLPWVYKF